MTLFPQLSVPEPQLAPPQSFDVDVQPQTFGVPPPPQESGAVQPPQSQVPPQPSETAPHFPEHTVAWSLQATHVPGPLAGEQVVCAPQVPQV